MEKWTPCEHLVWKYTATIFLEGNLAAHAKIVIYVAMIFDRENIK